MTNRSDSRLKGFILPTDKTQKIHFDENNLPYVNMFDDEGKKNGRSMLSKKSKSYRNFHNSTSRKNNH